MGTPKQQCWENWTCRGFADKCSSVCKEKNGCWSRWDFDWADDLWCCWFQCDKVILVSFNLLLSGTELFGKNSWLIGTCFRGCIFFLHGVKMNYMQSIHIRRINLLSTVLVFAILNILFKDLIGVDGYLHVYIEELTIVLSLLWLKFIYWPCCSKEAMRGMCERYTVGGILFFGGCSFFSLSLD